MWVIGYKRKIRKVGQITKSPTKTSIPPGRISPPALSYNIIFVGKKLVVVVSKAALDGRLHT